jgi:hypothetical protein
MQRTTKGRDLEKWYTLNYLSDKEINEDKMLIIIKRDI